MSGRRQSHLLLQRLHSTRVVAGVEILWHASAYKKNPLFRRRAPALNTVRPEGSPGGSSHYRDKAPRDPSERKSTDQDVREIWTADELAFSLNQRNAGNGHTLQKDGVCWVPRGREVCVSTMADTMRKRGLGPYFEIYCDLRVALRFALAFRPFWMGRVPLQLG